MFAGITVWWYAVKGMNHQGIFRIPGSQADINAYKLQFERGFRLTFVAVAAATGDNRVIMITVIVMMLRI